MELVTILADAFGVYWDRIVGPDWIQTDRYDIVANVPSGTTKEQAIQMLRNLFVERFHLTFHIQDKAVQGYELTVGAGGPKLKESTAEPIAPVGLRQPDASVEPSKDGFPVPPLLPGQHEGTRRERGRTYIRFADAPISDLALILSGSLNPGERSRMVSARDFAIEATPILDKTGLTGRYDFTFSYEGSPFFTAAAADGILSSVKSSLEKQLGLKLTGAKIPVQQLVIDNIDKTPTEN